MQTYEHTRNIPKGKEAKWQSQKQRIWRSLYYKPQTRLQVSVAEDVPIQSTCRIVGSLRKEGRIRIVKHDRCPISGMHAEFITTAPTPTPSGEQIPLFR